jgi:hypothetical protein
MFQIETCGLFLNNRRASLVLSSDVWPAPLDASGVDRDADNTMRMLTVLGGLVEFDRAS